MMMDQERPEPEGAPDPEAFQARLEAHLEGLQTELDQMEERMSEATDHERYPLQDRVRALRARLEPVRNALAGSREEKGEALVAMLTEIGNDLQDIERDIRDAGSQMQDLRRFP